MSENDLKVIVKAKELAVHSFKLTSNCNRYPKKYRHSLVDRIQIKSLDIYETLLEANRINNVTHKRERCEAHFLIGVYHKKGDGIASPDSKEVIHEKNIYASGACAARKHGLLYSARHMRGSWL